MLFNFVEKKNLLLSLVYWDSPSMLGYADIIMKYMRYKSMQHEEPILGLLIQTATKNRVSHIFVEEPSPDDKWLRSICEKAHFVLFRAMKKHMIDDQFKLVGAGAVSHKLSRPVQMKFELFDIVDDPSETTDVAAQHPEVVQRLQRRLVHWQQDCRNSFVGRDYPIRTP